MERDLPPTRDCDRLRKEVRLLPTELRGDAVQEAWLAHLKGDCPVLAVKTFGQRERRRRIRERLTGKLETAAVCRV